MSQLEDLDLITRAYDSQAHQIRARLEAFGQTYWQQMPDYREDSIQRLINAITPRVAAGQIQIAHLTNAYLRQCMILLDIPPTTAGVDEEAIIRARGVDPKEVYHRPASTVYANLAAGKSFNNAVRAGGLRLHQLIGGDMELAHRNQAHKTLRAGRSSGIRAYRRVLTGRENCALCVVASTQRYWVEDLLPIHPGCDCSVQPLPPGMENQQVIDPDLLDRAHAAVEDRYGSYAPDARAIDYREIILVSDHGEYGPVMGWKETVSQRRSRLFKPPKWNAKAPKGTIIPSNESRKLTITEEFCLKVYYGINGKGGHAYGMSPIGELAKSINTEFPKPWTLEDVIYAIEQTRDHPDIEYAGKASWRHLRKNVNGVICELRYSYAKKHDKATPRIFIPLSGTIEKDGKIYHVRMRDKSGYHDIPLHHPDLDASGIIDI